MSQRSTIKLFVLCSLTVGALIAPGSAYAGWTFTGTYIIDDINGGVSYTEAGSFAGYPICSVAWEELTPTVVPTTDLRHIEEIRFDSILRRWMHMSQQDLLKTVTESACAAETRLANAVNACAFSTQWTPNSPVLSPLPPASGWIEVANSRPAEQVALPGQLNKITRTLDLSYHDIQPKFSQGNVPFTGRISFVDETDGGPGRTGSMIAGRCVGSPLGGTQWNPGSHDFSFRALVGIAEDAAQVPGYGPFGLWTPWVEACNSGC